MNAATELRILAYVTGRDAHIRAAARLACTSSLRDKIDEYVDFDGAIDWARLADDLGSGLSWSTAELRLARLGCSLRGVLPDWLPQGRAVASWSIADMLTRLDDRDRSAALDAITLAAAGTR